MRGLWTGVTLGTVLAQAAGRPTRALPLPARARMRADPFQFPMRKIHPLAAGAALLLVACSATSTNTADTRSYVPTTVRVAAPMQGITNAYDEAGKFALPEIKAADYADLENVYRLSDRFISGGEPGGEEALARVASWGVKTILSVDGKAPDAATAARYGMRYVHVPIQYSGVTDEEQLAIVKTFRELEGPFYVHCFHGEHRSAAAAALGRLALDGISREQALAEMRQWAGTSPKYSGLFWDIATAEIPDEAATAAHVFDFPAAAPLDGVAGAMVQIARAFENTRDSIAVDYGVDPAHPDIEPLNEAQKLEQLFEASMRLQEVVSAPQDYRDWMQTSLADSKKLVAALRELRAGDAAAKDRVTSAVKAINASCNACHTPYRN